jgi:hypothetical protein
MEALFLKTAHHFGHTAQKVRAQAAASHSVSP